MKELDTNKLLVKTALFGRKNYSTENISPRHRGIFKKLLTPNPEKYKEFKSKQLEPLITTGAMALSLPFFIKALSSKGQEKEREERRKLLEQAALAKHPIVSPDPVIKNSVEQSLNKSGFELPLVNNTAGGNILEAPVDMAQGVFGLGDKDRTWTYPAISAALVAAALGTGAYWSNKTAGKKRSEELDEQLAKAKDQLDAVHYNILKSNKDEEEATQTKTSSESFKKMSGDFSYTKAAKQLIPLALLSLGYGGYKIGQNYAKQDMPKLKAYKAMKEHLQDRIKESDEPVQLMFSRDPAFASLFGRRNKEESRKERPVRTEELPSGSVSV